MFSCEAFTDNWNSLKNGILHLCNLWEIMEIKKKNEGIYERLWKWRKMNEWHSENCSLIVQLNWPQFWIFFSIFNPNFFSFTSFIAKYFFFFVFLNFSCCIKNFSDLQILWKHLTLFFFFLRIFVGLYSCCHFAKALDSEKLPMQDKNDYFA